MTQETYYHPPSGLDERFCMPNDWHWCILSRDGYHIRYGYVLPQGTEKTDKVVIALPGLSEFCEKYFELARNCLDQGYGFVVIDWRGQGKSSRYLENPHKRHSQGMDHDADDLKAVLDDLSDNISSADLYMMAHSMGGNIGLRFLENYRGVFSAASFASPMIGLHVFEALPNFLSGPLAHGLQATMAENYAPMGGDWEPYSRDLQSLALFSTDSKRGDVHNCWMKYDEELRIGHITNRWLYDANRSCHYLQHDLNVSQIDLPCLFFMAGHENFVDNGKIKSFARRLQKAHLIEYPVARHEIWMETDVIRHDFLNHFFTLIRHNEL